MKSADGPARDSNEREGKKIAGENRPTAIDKARERGHLQSGANQENSQRQNRDGAKLYEGAEIVARRQQQPYWKRGGGKAINNDQNRQRGAGKCESAGMRGLRNPLPAEDRRNHQQKAEHGSFQHASR